MCVRPLKAVCVLCCAMGSDVRLVWQQQNTQTHTKAKSNKSNENKINIENKK